MISYKQAFNRNSHKTSKMKLLNFCLLLILSLNQIYGSIILEAYRCEDMLSTTCTLQDISFDDDDSIRFLPKSKVPRTVSKVSFVSSKIPVLTSDICDNFPNLEILEMNEVSLKVVDTEALSGCTKLKEIQLRDNFLSTLDKDTFQQNKMLKKIILNNNNLTTIPQDLFKGLQELTWIDLCSNLLSRLPAVTFSGLTEIVNLEVRNNPLLSLEVEEMRKEMPNLKYLLLRDLDLTCDRLRQVQAFVGTNGLNQYIRPDYSTYHSKSYQSAIRSRPYSISYEGTQECLSNEQWEREVLLRETLSNALKTTPVSENYEIELQKSFGALKEEINQKMEELVKETRETQSTYFMKIFEGQNFMFKLLKDKIESLENIEKNKISHESDDYDSE